PGIDPQPRRIVEYPAQRCGGIVQRRGPFVFRGQAILHRDNPKAALMREEPTKAVMGIEVSDHKAAAMEIHQRRHRRATRRDGSIGTSPYLTLRSGNL